MDIVAARILDEDKARHGVQREGTFGSLSGVLGNTSGLFVAASFFLVARIFGYQSGENPGSRPVDAAKFLISVFPFFLMTACCILSLFLRFDNGAANGNTTESGNDTGKSPIKS
jgi:GPH family glycoside/pentoside/hexuronide:cation symporter